ncbi:MAG: phosphodiesterase, partial [Thermoleophilia bacterium]
RLVTLRSCGEVRRLMPRQTFTAGEPEGLAQLVNYEALTGLPDRTLLVDRLEAAVAQAHRFEHLVALVIIELNTSTEMRAALGFEAGKELTLMVADHLRRFARKSDTLAYIGSDLFAIVMPRVHDLPQILSLTKRLVELFDGPWELAGQSLHLVPGVGIAYIPENGTEPAELVAQAVTAASYAAREGDHRPHLAHRLGYAEARGRLALEADLRQAVEKEELLLHYQPQVNAANGCVAGFEALLRWQHRERGLLPPHDFISLAEETRLIAPIGSWVIAEACRQLAAWREAGHADVRVAVNLAAEQLAGDGLTAEVGEALVRHGLQPGQLEVEVTERTAIADEATMAGALAELRALGVRLTLDDFGTGYSAAMLLVQYPFDTLKIDRSFVIRVLDGERQRAVTAAIISLAHAAGLTVVAEGVETREQLRAMHEIGADEIQGYYFSQPVSAAACGPFLTGRCAVETGRLA